VTDLVRGVVINLNAFGATIRLEDGRLASALGLEVNARHAEYERAVIARKSLKFECRIDGTRWIVSLAPQIDDDDLDEKIAGYLKSTGEWESFDAPPAHERRFLQKKRRAALFEDRRTPDSGH
jgi:hypothetical protein